MSVISFKIGDLYYRARIFERSSSKYVCTCCGIRKYGVLIRHLEPKKYDTLICDECIVNITLGNPIIYRDAEGNPVGVFEKRKRRIKPDACIHRAKTEQDKSEDEDNEPVVDTLPIATDIPIQEPEIEQQDMEVQEAELAEETIPIIPEPEQLEEKPVLQGDPQGDYILNKRPLYG